MKVEGKNPTHTKKKEASPRGKRRKLVTSRSVLKERLADVLQAGKDGSSRKHRTARQKRSGQGKSMSKTDVIYLFKLCGTAEVALVVDCAT